MLARLIKANSECCWQIELMLQFGILILESNRNSMDFIESEVSCIYRGLSRLNILNKRDLNLSTRCNLSKKVVHLESATYDSEASGRSTLVQLLIDNVVQSERINSVGSCHKFKFVTSETILSSCFVRRGKSKSLANLISVLRSHDDHQFLSLSKIAQL